MVERLRLRRYREVRLGMAPRTWPRIPEMVFDERLIYEIWDDEGWRGWIPYGSPAPGRQWEVWEYNDRPPAAVDVYPDMGTAEHPYTGDRACWIWEVGAARRHSGKSAESGFPQRWLDHGVEGFGLPIDQFVEPVGLNSCVHYLGEALDNISWIVVMASVLHSAPAVALQKCYIKCYRACYNTLTE